MVKRSDGRWQERVILSDGSTKYFYGKTKAELMRKVADAKSNKDRGIRFVLAAEEWNAVHEKAVSYNAHRCYSQPYKSAVEEFGNKRIKDISTPEIDLYIKRIAAKGYAKRTVQSYLTVVNLIFEHAMLQGYTDSNPASVVPLPPHLKSTQRTLPSEDDIARVKAAVDKPFGFFAFFLMYTGLRRGEALALTYDDIDLKNKTISVSKSMYWVGNTPNIKSTKTEAGNRTVILLDAVAKRLPEGSGYLFGGEKPLTNTMFRRRWDKYVRESGIDLSCHQLRHLYATILYEAGIDEKIAQELMGHSSITVTRNIYTHIRKNRLTEAAETLNKLVGSI